MFNKGLGPKKEVNKEGANAKTCGDSSSSNSSPSSSSSSGESDGGY